MYLHNQEEFKTLGQISVVVKVYRMLFLRQVIGEAEISVAAQDIGQTHY